MKVKTEKIKKIHIWPSIIVFIISAVIGYFALTMFIDFYIANLADGKLAVPHCIGNTIKAELTEANEEGTQYDQLLPTIVKRYDSLSDIFILDSEYNVICGQGEPSFDTESLSSYYFLEKIFFMNDKDNEAKFNLDEFIYRFNIKDIEGFDNDDVFDESGNIIQTQYMEISYWEVQNLPDDNLLVYKGLFTIYTKELFVLLVMMFIIALIIILPLIFLFVNVIRAISNQRKMTKIMALDTETGGSNWHYFRNETDRIVRKRSSKKKTFAIIDLEVMKFRNYQTYNGAKAGNELLAEINNYFIKKTKRREYFAHYGKANFAMMLRCESENEVIDRLEDMINGFKCSSSDNITFHGGIYFLEPNYDTKKNKYIKREEDKIPDWYNNASLARATIDEAEGNKVICFNQELLAKQLWEHKVEENMEEALKNKEFIVYLQPKYNPVTNELSGAEALIRWISPTEGFIGPGRFIPLFEKNGFITKIDDYMISNVARLQAEWIKAGKKVVPVSVNVSRAHFTQEDLAEHICELVDRYDVPHKYIEIELTESAFFDDKATLHSTVTKIKEYGFEVSMDDFGAGYSSLNSLKDLPLDVLKLDAEFFRDEKDTERAKIVVTSAIDLAKHLNMRIVAEGIEKKEQVDFLATVGCDMIQGFYYSKPIPTEKYEEKMQNI